MCKVVYEIVRDDIDESDDNVDNFMKIKLNDCFIENNNENISMDYDIEDDECVNMFSSCKWCVVKWVFNVKFKKFFIGEVVLMCK